MHDDTLLPTDDAPNLPPGLSPVLWGVYLGVSWTWVIGMFLPVLLVRDYGQWAWWVFAIPNCFGAAAMGWVMRSSEHSRRFVEDHRLACRLFSLVTIAFHLFFAVWMLPRLIGSWGWIVVAAAVQIAFTPLQRRPVVYSAVVVFVISVVVGIGLLNNGGLTDPPSVPTPATVDVIALSLVCLLGFALCPYLDLTFHHARQSTTPAGGKFAFASGFLIIFASMIVLTLFYADGLINLSSGSLFTKLLAVHVGVQICFTVMAHARVLADDAAATAETAVVRSGLGAALAFGLFAGMAVYFFTSHGKTLAGLSPGEVAYRLFMTFYGLIVPAYLLCRPLGRLDDATDAAGGSINDTQHSRVRRWGLFVAVILLATPFYFVAFLLRELQWVIPGVGIILVGGLFSHLLNRGQVRPVAEVTRGYNPN